MTLPGIPDSTVRRLSHYLRCLDALAKAGRATVSSSDLASCGGVTPAQVRKDLSRFGSFGKRGLGYPVPVLRKRVAEILGVGRRWRVCLVGAGRLGAALFQYEGFREQGFDFVAVFDNDAEKIGSRWNGLRIDDVARMGRVVEERGIEIGVVVTPAAEAQAVADALAEAGISAILNFAPSSLNLPDRIALKDVNLAIELETLTFALTHRDGNPARTFSR